MRKLKSVKIHATSYSSQCYKLVGNIKTLIFKSFLKPVWHFTRRPLHSFLKQFQYAKVWYFTMIAYLIDGLNWKKNNQPTLYHSEVYTHSAYFALITEWLEKISAPKNKLTFT